MSKSQIAIIVAAHNINKDIIDRFIWFAKNSESNLAFDIILGSHESSKETFRKTTILNDILRENLANYNIFIQTDIDMLIPPHLIQYTSHIASTDNLCFHCNYRYVEAEEADKWTSGPYFSIPWREISLRKKFSASGSWNGLNRTSWIKTHGFNESIYNLGGPDTEFYMRSVKLGIRWLQDNNIPLSHINHKRRSVPKQGKQNMNTAKQFPTNYDWLNNRHAKTSPTILNYTRVNNG
jgi:hypothetical protein